MPGFGKLHVRIFSCTRVSTAWKISVSSASEINQCISELEIFFLQSFRTVLIWICYEKSEMDLSSCKN